MCHLRYGLWALCSILGFFSHLAVKSHCVCVYNCQLVKILCNLICIFFTARHSIEARGRPIGVHFTILSSMQHVRGLQALGCTINLTWLDFIGVQGGGRGRGARPPRTFVVGQDCSCRERTSIYVGECRIIVVLWFLRKLFLIFSDCYHFQNSLDN